MVTREDLESFFLKMNLDYEEVDEGMYLLHAEEGGPPIVVHHSPPVLIVRVKLMDLEGDDTELLPLYKTLLQLNVTDVVHGAYGLEDGEVILSDTLELETLDFEEVQASLESLQLAVSGHMDQLVRLAAVGGEGE